MAGEAEPAEVPIQGGGREPQPKETHTHTESLMFSHENPVLLGSGLRNWPGKHMEGPRSGEAGATFCVLW